MDRPTTSDINVWMSHRRRSSVRKTFHGRISSSQNQSQAVVEQLQWLQAYYKQLQEMDDDASSKHVRFQVLAMAMHLCETYKFNDEEIVGDILKEMFTSFSIGVWFQFLNPFGTLNSVLSTVETDSLYPFRHAWRNYCGAQEKCWITKRHLVALEYYLSKGNKQVFVDSHERTPNGGSAGPLILSTTGDADTSRSRCVNGHYLTLRPNLEALRLGDNVRHEQRTRPTTVLPTEFSSDDDSEISRLTADLVPALDRFSLNSGRFRPVVGEEDSSDSDYLGSSTSSYKSEQEDHDRSVISQPNTTVPVHSRQSQTETNTTVAQNNVYSTVTMVNYPLESSVLGVVTPLTLACIQGAPHATLLLLRHGATPIHYFSSPRCHMHDLGQPLLAVVNQMNLFSKDILDAVTNGENRQNLATMEETRRNLTDRHILEYLNTFDTEVDSRTLYRRSIMGSRGRNWLKCLGHLSLVMKTWPKMMTEEDTTSHVCPAQGPRLDIRFAKYLPEFCSGTIPADLQHQSRCTIRDTLRHIRRLPDGIQNLPLPDSIKDYIDLKQ